VNDGGAGSADLRSPILYMGGLMRDGSFTADITAIRERARQKLLGA
jgi:hypothetical protein